jgi:hypothetical protein
MPVPVNELLECIQHSMNNEGLRSVDLDMPNGLLTITFHIPQRLVSKFVKACDTAEKVVTNE